MLLDSCCWLSTVTAARGSCSGAVGVSRLPLSSVCVLPHCRPGAKPGDAPVVTPEARSIEYPSLAAVVTAPANKVWPLRKDLGAPFLAWRGV